MITKQKISNTNIDQLIIRFYILFSVKINNLSIGKLPEDVSLTTAFGSPPPVR